MRDIREPGHHPDHQPSTEWSEDTNTQFEPREDHKGNLARTRLSTSTPCTAASRDLAATGHADINSLANIQTLYQWHLADPVDAHEIERNRRARREPEQLQPLHRLPQPGGHGLNLAPHRPGVSALPPPPAPWPKATPAPPPTP
ncbi:MAG: endonuclease [Hymenobacter sp.]